LFGLERSLDARRREHQVAKGVERSRTSPEPDDIARIHSLSVVQTISSGSGEVLGPLHSLCDLVLAARQSNERF